MKLLEYLKVLPSLDELPAAPKRIIGHWTGGSGRANEGWDRPAYHFLFESDGKLVLGHRSVAENMRPLKSGMKYAAHTGGLNSYSVGVSACGMAGARPWAHFGAHPLTQEQVRAMMGFCGVAAWWWGLDPLNPEHLFTHMEAWTLHKVAGTTNRTKFDIGMLPWGTMKPEEVGPYLRRLAVEEADKLFTKPEIKLVGVQERKLKVMKPLLAA